MGLEETTERMRVWKETVQLAEYLDLVGLSGPSLAGLARFTATAVYFLVSSRLDSVSSWLVQFFF